MRQSHEELRFINRKGWLYFKMDNMQTFLTELTTDKSWDHAPLILPFKHPLFHLVLCNSYHILVTPKPTMRRALRLLMHGRSITNA